MEEPTVEYDQGFVDGKNEGKRQTQAELFTANEELSVETGRANRLHKRCRLRDEEIEELQAKLSELRNRIETFEESSAMDARVINQWAERYKKIKDLLDNIEKF